MVAVNTVRWCRCGGENSNCMYCSGKGWLNPGDEVDVPQPVRAAVPSRSAAIAAMRGTLRPMARCELCGVPVRKDRLERHRSRVHGDPRGRHPLVGPKAARSPRPPHLTAPRVAPPSRIEAAAPLRATVEDLAARGREPKDATYGIGAFARDQGRFGSPVAYDDYGEEGDP